MNVRPDGCGPRREKCTRRAEKWLQVASLFSDHDDLLEEFTYFLPDSQAPHRAAMERQRQLAEQAALQGGQPVSRRRVPAAALHSHVRPLLTTLPCVHTPLDT